MIVSGFTLLLSISASGQTPPHHDRFKQQRELFLTATQEINEQKTNAAATKLKQLTDYPLLPYLEYQLLLSKLSQQPLPKIQRFIKKYPELPITKRLRLKAIVAKAKYRHWDDVLTLYQAGDSIRYQCFNIKAIYHRQDKKRALTMVNDIWLTGHSLPKSCDSLLTTWKNSGRQSQDLIWQRIELAFEQRNHRLAKFLAKSLNHRSQKKFKSWYRLYQKPQRLVKNYYRQQHSTLANSMLKIAVVRLIQQDLQQAIEYWPTIKSMSQLSTPTLVKLSNKLALKIIVKNIKNQQHWLKKIDWTHLSKSQNNQLLRAFVVKKQWHTIIELYATQQEPNSAWQYWYASALELKNKHQLAQVIFSQLADKRHYYGFLASDKLMRPYQLNHHELTVSPALITKISNTPAAQRAYELFKLNRFIEARREWYYLVKSLSQPQRLAAAQIADNWQWHNRAIITLTMTEQRDDLDIRFPMPHLEKFRQEAKVNNMAPTWPLAISRQESAFMAQARSSAGAMGLMQLMPGTARQQAKALKIKYRRRSQLFSADFNIKLGTGYLAKMLNKFDHNIAVAAAAYNAGPHRVKRWVTKVLPQDQWIESIPYKETRQYVKNILAYTVIYQHHLQLKSRLPSAAIDPQKMDLH